MDGSCLRATIQISNDPSGHIIVSFPYDPLTIEKVKTIEGRRWHPAEKHRSFPKLDSLLEKILKVFGEGDVQIDPALQTDSSKGKDTPSLLAPDGHTSGSSPLGGEGRGEGYDFEDLRKELVSRTEIYNHVSTKSLGKIRSPLDSLELAKGGEE